MTAQDVTAQDANNASGNTAATGGTAPGTTVVSPTDVSSPLAVSPPTGNGGQIFSMGVGLNSNTSLQVLTAEGDVVTLKLEYGAMMAQSTSLDGMNSVSGGSMQLSMSLEVQGDLNHEELEAIEKLVKKADKIAQKLMNGDVGAAMHKLSKMKADDEVLAGFSLESVMSLKAIVDLAQAPSDEAPADPAATGTNVPVAPAATTPAPTTTPTAAAPATAATAAAVTDPNAPAEAAAADSSTHVAISLMVELRSLALDSESTKMFRHGGGFVADLMGAALNGRSRAEHGEGHEHGRGHGLSGAIRTMFSGLAGMVSAYQAQNTAAAPASTLNVAA